MSLFPISGAFKKRMAGTVLITGGLGYLGGRIAKFLSENTKLRLLVSTREPYSETPGWLRNGRVIRLDLSSDHDIAEACENVQYIVHLAALNEIESLKDPELALTVNGLSTLRLLRAAEKAEIERFIYFSTAHVYGSPLKGIITETNLPRPVHPYAITHKVAEDFVLASNDLKSLTGIVVRLSNGFGAPINTDVNRWSLIVNDLCRQAVTTGKLVLRTSGVQKRDFITLTDVSRAVWHLLNLSCHRCGDGLFNLGGEYCLKIIEMAEMISNRCFHLFHFRPVIKCAALLPDETSDYLEFCIDKIKSTGFQPVRNIEDEIDSTLLFCQKHFSSCKVRTKQ